VKFKELIKKEQPFFGVSLSFVWQGLFFYLPLIFIVLLSLIQPSVIQGYYKIGVANFIYFFNLSYVMIILKSFGLALINCILCFVVGYPIAYFLAFRAGRFRNLFLFLLILPFWTNFLLHVYAWFYVLEKAGFLSNLLLFLGLIKEPIGFLNSYWTILVVMMYCYLPFMVLPIYSVLERLNKNVLEASADLGASSLQTWLRITLPLSLSGLKSGFFLVFVPSFGEFAIPGLIGGDKYVFVGTVISQFILSNGSMNLGAAFTLISSIALIGLIMAIYIIGYNYIKNFGKIDD